MWRGRNILNGQQEGEGLELIGHCAVVLEIELRA